MSDRAPQTIASIFASLFIVLFTLWMEERIIAVVSDRLHSDDPKLKGAGATILFATMNGIIVLAVLAVIKGNTLVAVGCLIPLSILTWYLVRVVR